MIQYAQAKQRMQLVNGYGLMDKEQLFTKPVSPSLMKTPDA